MLTLGYYSGPLSLGLWSQRRRPAINKRCLTIANSLWVIEFRFSMSDDAQSFHARLGQSQSVKHSQRRSSRDPTTAKPQPSTWVCGTLEEEKEDWWSGEEGRRDRDSDWGEEGRAGRAGAEDWSRSRTCSIIFILGCGLPRGYRCSDEAWRMNYYK